MMLFISCFIIHLTTSPKLRISAAIDCPYKYSNTLIHYPFVLILAFAFLLMIWPQFSFFWPFWLLSRVFTSYYLFDLLVPLHQIPTEQPSFFVITSSRDIRNIIWMLHLVLLGFRHSSSQNKKVYALSSLLALFTTTDDVPDLSTFFSSSLRFKYLLLTLSKMFRAVSPEITKNKESLICAQASLAF